LSKVADLRVISRTSVLQYAGFKGDVRQVARELGVSHILEGSVRRSGNRVRVTAQLIDARDDEHVWAENYDRDLTDVFAIQTEVAQEIVKALKASLSPQEAKLIEARPTRNVEAYDAYLQARDQIHTPEYSAEKFFRALPLAQKAVELDPDFALAYLQLADIYGQLYWLSAYDEAYIAEARNALDQAQRLSPDLPEIRVGLGEFYYRMESDFPKALKEFELAQLQLPNNGNLLMRLGFTQRRVGLWDESIASFRRGITLDPANNFLVSGLAETLYNAGRWREAVAVLQQETAKHPEYVVFRVNEALYRLLGDGDLTYARQVLESIAPVSDQGYVGLATITPWWSRDFQGAVDAWNGIRSLDETLYKYVGLNALGKIYLTMDNHALAEKHFQLAIQNTKDELEHGGIDSYAYHQIRGVAHAYLGENEAALKEIDQAVAMRSESADRLEGPTVSILRAEVWMLVGKTDEAISEIERLLKYPIAVTPAGLRLDPTWDPLRENPRFKALLAKVADQ
jgi:tetratricopeptide (TPR) repeat protein